MEEAALSGSQISALTYLTHQDSTALRSRGMSIEPRSDGLALRQEGNVFPGIGDVSIVQDTWPS